jgi:hypothetical protein
LKPAKAAGKQKTPAQTASGEADNISTRTSTLSLFEQALCAARELWLGPPVGEPGKIGELENETLRCEHSTAQAILAAQPTEKLSAFYHGFDDLQEKLCAAAAKYYNACFELALRNGVELDATRRINNPAEFARSLTSVDLSTFLRITALDGKEAREIGSNGRVREFVRHACGDYFDVLPSLLTGQNTIFRLPRWPTGRSFGSRIAQRPITPANGDESSTLSVEETEEFILGVEETLIKNLRVAIADAHRIALVKLSTTGIATPVPLKTAPVSAFWPEMPEYRSELKKAVRTILGQEPDASDHRLCEVLDETMNVDRPPGWTKPGNREFTVAYEDKQIRPKMERLFSGVRRDMRAAGYRIP